VCSPAHSRCVGLLRVERRVDAYKAIYGDRPDSPIR